MRKALAILAFLVGATFVAAVDDTRSIRPRADGEGSIGGGGRAWGTGVFNRVFIGGVESYALPAGAPGVNQVAQWNGSNWVALAIGSPTQPPAAGTNVTRWDTPFSITNQWIVPAGVTGCWMRAWGGGAPGVSGGGGGYIAGYVPVVPGEIFEIIVGSRATNGATPALGAQPGGGRGGNGGAGGGSYTAIRKGVGDTNASAYVLVAGGGGGAQTVSGGPGGGYVQYAQDASGSTTNVSGGGGAWALDEYGTSATAGTPLISTNALADGTWLQGGDAYTNGSTSGVSSHSGGGGGWYGGAGSFQYLPGSTPTTCQGGGGLSYANPAYVSWAVSIRATRPTSVTIPSLPAGTEHPSYTAGRGVGAISSGHGSQGCAGVEY